MRVVDDLVAVDEDRDVPLTRQLLDLRTLAAPLRLGDGVELEPRRA
jgi:hypothetical protein